MLFAAAAYASEINLNGKILALGDSKPKVIEELSPEYTLLPTNKEDTFLIMGAEFGDTEGAVTFDNNKLKFASLERIDRNETRTTGEVLSLLTALLTENSEKSKSKMTVSVSDLGGNTHTNSFLSFTFPDRRVTVSIQKNIATGKESIGISEAIVFSNE